MKKLLIAFAAITLISGCAKTDDVKALQVKVDALQSQLSRTENDLIETKALVKQATESADRAMQATSQLELSLQEMNEKVTQFMQKNNLN